MQDSTRLHIFYDSGAPAGSDDYTTIVILHGLGWNSHIFMKLVPLAHAHNARIVLVNRPDYRGATAYTSAERARLSTTIVGAMTGAPAARLEMVAFMKEAAVDLYKLLVSFVVENRPPPAHAAANSGGLVVAGWSLGTAWMTAFLSSVGTFPVDNVNLSDYVRRIVFYDPPHLALGFAPPEDGYMPFTDLTIRPENVVNAFYVWVSAFYQHGETGDKLELRMPLSASPPTFTTLTGAERDSVLDLVPPDPRGGSDMTVMDTGFSSGAFATLREEALTIDASGSDAAKGWDAVEVRHVCCDASPWVMPCAFLCMQEEIGEKKKAGHVVRNVVFLRLRGANHFVHWEEPERALKAFLEELPMQDAGESAASI